MILNKNDYRSYLEQDRIALGKKKSTLNGWLFDLVFPDYIYRFQRLLRKIEYTKNCKTGFISKCKYLFLQKKFRKISLRLGFSIPPNVFGPGLSIVHYGTIVVNANAKVGSNCRIHPSTCIGASGGSGKAPQIGDNVYIAPGVKIYGEIVIGNNIATAANSAIGKSFTEENILIGGVPAIRLKEIDISRIIKHINKS